MFGSAPARQQREDLVRLVDQRCRIGPWIHSRDAGDRDRDVTCSHMATFAVLSPGVRFTCVDQTRSVWVNGIAISSSRARCSGDSDSTNHERCLACSRPIVGYMLAQTTSPRPMVAVTCRPGGGRGLLPLDSAPRARAARLHRGIALGFIVRREWVIARSRESGDAGLWCWLTEHHAARGPCVCRAGSPAR